ncbi:MAG: DUF4391 domain-containing protein [Burkholderiales bacterium]|nr:DUF4391 domain-containing protein [Burkholderiales bacterium]
MTAGMPPTSITAAAVLAALALPPAALVQQRVPKKLLIESGAPTAADKRLINDGIEAIHWLASLKPATVGVPAFKDDSSPPVREYLELAVLSVQLRAGGKAQRIAELVHRAIPYPVLLMVELEDRLTMTVAHIRWAQNEVNKVVLDGPVHEVGLDAQVPPALLASFLNALALERLPRADLYALVQGLIDTFTRFQAAQLSGHFAEARTPDHAAAQRAALQRCIEIDKSIAELRSAAIKEKQLPRQVAMNLDIKRLQAERAAVVAKLM